MSSTRDSNRESEPPAEVFERVLVGVDGSEAGFEACRQAARLAKPGAAVEAVAVVHVAEAARTGPTAPRVANELRRDADSALEEAASILGDRCRTRFVNGLVTEALLSEVETTDSTVLVVGSHGHRRMTEILVGGVTGELLHSAPCALLVARPPVDAATFPRSIVVGIDGSREAESALRAAERLAGRFDASLRVVVARRGKGVDLAGVHARARFAEEIDEEPVDALVHAARGADLLVVGSRGLHGLRALGSVSERIAHQATCSVLVVREAWER
jgi:nucleotide-binding universal stress UspA family protein